MPMVRLNLINTPVSIPMRAPMPDLNALKKFLLSKAISKIVAPIKGPRINPIGPPVTNPEILPITAPQIPALLELNFFAPNGATTLSTREIIIDRRKRISSIVVDGVVNSFEYEIHVNEPKISQIPGRFIAEIIIPTTIRIPAIIAAIISHIIFN